MTLLAHLEPRVDSGADRRSAGRRKLTLDSQLVCVGAEAIIHDLSATGLLLETEADLNTGEAISVQLPNSGQAEARVMWCSGRLFGCEFRRRIDQATVSAALLQSVPRGGSQLDLPGFAAPENAAREAKKSEKGGWVALALLGAVSVVAGAYLFITEAPQLLAISAAILAVLLVALVAWGNSILDDLPM